jgi:hypothetical protein
MEKIALKWELCYSEFISAQVDSHAQQDFPAEMDFDKSVCQLFGVHFRHCRFSCITRISGGNGLRNQRFTGKWGCA